MLDDGVASVVPGDTITWSATTTFDARQSPCADVVAAAAAAFVSLVAAGVCANATDACNAEPMTPAAKDFINMIVSSSIN